MVLTHNRRVRLLQTIRALKQSLPERWLIMVVDNGSTDGTAKAVGREFPGVMLISSRRNIGAAARNIAVAYVHTPYVAFCGDDTLWEPGALQRAARVMDENPNIGVVNGCILEGDAGRLNPGCAAMAASPLDREGLPGPQLLSFMADACVIRTRAFYEAGGFWPPFFADGEEALLALDLANRGWRMVYLEEVLLRRTVPILRNPWRRRSREVRNAIWVAWMRLPLKQAWQETLAQLRVAARHRQLKRVLMLSLAGMLPVIRKRRVIAPSVAAMWSRLADAGWRPIEERPAQPVRRYLA